MRVVLRAGTLRDLPALYSIYMHERVNPFLGFEPMALARFRPVFRKLISGGELLVYEAEREIAATCIVTLGSGRTAHVATIGTLATNPSFQGRGIGTKFVREVLSRLRRRGARRVELFVESDNPIAIRFYKKLGFKREGVLRRYFKRAGHRRFVDEHVMALLFGGR